MQLIFCFINEQFYEMKIENKKWKTIVEAILKNFIFEYKIMGGNKKSN